MGGMGMACARRLGPGRQLVVADHDAARLADCTAELQSNGLDVVGHAVDVSIRSSVVDLAATVGELGRLRTLVHTAGLSPTMASPTRVLEVDMLGTDHVLTVVLPHPMTAPWPSASPAWPGIWLECPPSSNMRWPPWRPMICSPHSDRWTTWASAPATA